MYRGPKQKNSRRSRQNHKISPARKRNGPGGPFRSAAKGRLYRSPKQKKRREAHHKNNTSPARNCMSLTNRPNPQFVIRRVDASKWRRQCKETAPAWALMGVRAEIAMPAAFSREKPWVAKSSTVLPGQIADFAIHGFPPAQSAGIYRNPPSPRIISHRERWNPAVLENRPKAICGRKATE